MNDVRVFALTLPLPCCCRALSPKCEHSRDTPAFRNASRALWVRHTAYSVCLRGSGGWPGPPSIP
jgi:hypothetical protein